MRPGVDNELQRLLERKPPEFDVRVAEDQTGVRGRLRRGRDHRRRGSRRRRRRFLDPFQQPQCRRFRLALDQRRRQEGTIIQVPVDDGREQITITGVNEFGYLTERSVVALGKKTREGRKKGKLYVVVVGAEKYPFLPTDCSGRSCDLRYPVDDAAELARRAGRKVGAALSPAWRRWCWSTASRSTRRPSWRARIGADRRRRRRARAGGRQRSTTRSPISWTSRPPTTRPSCSSPATASISTRTITSSRPTAGKSDAGQMEALLAGRVGRHPEGGRARRRRALHAARHLPRRQRLQPAAREGRGRRAHRGLLGDRRQQHGRRAARARPRRLHLLACSKGCAARPTPAATACACSGSPTSSIAR